MSNCPGRGLGHRSSRLRRARVVVVITAAAGLALLVAACSSSGSSPTAGGTTSSSSGVSTGSGGGTQATGLLQYASCMRSHGITNFPDPASNGGIPKETSQQLGVSDSQLGAAQSVCRRLVPGRSLSGQASQTVTVQQQQDYLNVAACMRSHGITNFPDPVFPSGSVEFPNLTHTVDVHSPQFTQAYHACQKLIPAGLPYSSGAGG